MTRRLVLLMSLASLWGCKDLASVAKTKAALVDHAADCGVDLSSLGWASSSGKENLAESRASFTKKFRDVRNLLQKSSVRWDFAMAPEIEKRCVLDRAIILASPGILGFVDNIHWAFKSLVVQENLSLAVQRVRVIVTPLKGVSLYEANRSAQAYLLKTGERVLDFYVNLGDPYAGISFSNLMKNLTSRELLSSVPKILRQHARPMAR